jgi:hypothetical protein
MPYESHGSCSKLARPKRFELLTPRFVVGRAGKPQPDQAGCEQCDSAHSIASAFRTVTKLCHATNVAKRDIVSWRSLVRGRTPPVRRAPDVDLSDHRRRLRVSREPQCAGGTGRIEPVFLPPARFIAVTMQLAMMSPAEWHREFVADLAAKCTRLREA